MQTLSEYYRLRIRPHIINVRGSTRLSRILERIAITPYVERVDGAYRSKEHGFLMSSASDFRYFIREKSVVNHFTAALDEDAVVADIGSFHGFYGLLASTVTDAPVYCFEPSPTNHNILKKNIDLNGKDNLHLIEQAAWNQDGTHTFKDAANSSHLGSGDTTVDTVTLDTFFEDRSPPDIIKMDVQGAELDVISGAKRIIEKHAPVLIIEIHPPHSVEDLQEKLGTEYSTETLLKRPEETILRAWA